MAICMAFLEVCMAYSGDFVVCSDVCMACSGVFEVFCKLFNMALFNASGRNRTCRMGNSSYVVETDTLY